MPVEWPSLQSIAMAYWPTRLIALGAHVLGDGRRLQQRAARRSPRCTARSGRRGADRARGSGLVAVGPLDGDRRAQQADDLVGHRHGGVTSPRALRRSSSFSSGATCSACTKPPLVDQRLRSPRSGPGARGCPRSPRATPAPARHALGQEGVGQVVLQRRVRRQRHQQRPAAAAVAGLLQQLAPRRRLERRVLGIGRAGRDLEVHRADAVAVLADQHHLIVGRSPRRR